MKQLVVLIIFFLAPLFLAAQASGNINYHNQVSGSRNYQNQVHFPDNNIDVPFNNNNEIIVGIKGMGNLKANAYVAIFNVTQVGTTTEEVNQLVDERINAIKNKVNKNSNAIFYVDMISFVPAYEYNVEKKIFSKKTYNEVPKGFELKKNIHIQYQDPNYLNEIIAFCADAEVYDMIRVDYFSDDLDSTKKQLSDKAKILLKEKLKDYEEISGIQLVNAEKQLVEDFKIVYPVEMYKSYQAYASSSLNLNPKKSSKVHQADKSITLYYQPVIDKEFDFVINPTILEPVIQVMYEIKVKVRIVPIPPLAPVQPKPEKQYLFLTPNGDVINLDIGQ